MMKIVVFSDIAIMENIVFSNIAAGDSIRMKHYEEDNWV
jgi:hypothetical protein